MITNWLVRGDCHGRFDWLNELQQYRQEETAIIILGDVGLNFFLNNIDKKNKEFVESWKYYLYCVRGNHEARPQHLDSMEYIFDKNVNGWVMYEPEYPHIRYFKDYGIYTINEYRCLVIGGAYSVDKWHRLARWNFTEGTNVATKSGWFNDEQLSELEMKNCETLIGDDNEFDFVFTHTCPTRFQPTDLFLGFVNQSKVDTTMEIWLDKIYDIIKVKHAWCFGHYHADRLERPHVEQYFNDIESLEMIVERWNKFEESGELDWYLRKSPFFYINI